MSSFQRANPYTLALVPGFHIALGQHGPCVLDDAGWQILQGFTVPRMLHDAFDQRLAAEGLVVSQETSPALPHPRTLTAWMHVTSRCNLACPYCYAVKSQEVMSLQTGNHVFDRLVNTALEGDFKALKLKYAGGEAALEFARLQELHASAIQHTRQAGLELAATLLSNGTSLTISSVDWLAAQDIKVMISLDGVGEAHDRLRRTTAGASTFARIERVVDELLLPRGIQPFISMTLSVQNAFAAADMARWCIERSLPLSYNFMRAADSATGAPHFDHAAVLAGMRAAYQVFEELLPEQPFLNGLLDRFQASAHTRTCGAGSEYMVIAADGSQHPCHMLIDQPAESTVLHNLSVDEKQGCSDCDFRLLCTGGCPLETFHSTGSWDQPSPHCDLYRELIPEALRLEGLRLLKINGYSQ